MVIFDHWLSKVFVAALGVLLAAPVPGASQHVNDRPAAEPGAWTYIGGDAGHTRSTPLNQIDASNFSDLEVEWTWSNASFGATPPRSTPVYAGGKLFTVAGPRRHVVALDPRHGGDALDVSRAQHLPLGVFHARALGEGDRVRGGGR